MAIPEGIRSNWLTETWVEERNWEKIKKKLPKEFEWKCNTAWEENRKRRAKGGIVTGVRKGMMNIEYKEWGRQVVMQRIKHKEREWTILTVYC